MIQIKKNNFLMSELKFNGLYYYLNISENINYVFRFFEKNNLVIGTSIGAKNNIYLFANCFPNKVWFNEFYEQKGKYTISENKISFMCCNVSYDGTILDNGNLSLFSHSYINEYEATEEYKFISFDVLNDIETYENLNENKNK